MEVWIQKRRDNGKGPRKGLRKQCSPNAQPTRWRASDEGCVAPNPACETAQRHDVPYARGAGTLQQAKSKGSRVHVGNCMIVRDSELSLTRKEQLRIGGAHNQGSSVVLLRWGFEVTAAQLRTRCKFTADGNRKARSTLWEFREALLLEFFLFSQPALLKHPHPCITELGYFSWARSSRILSLWYVHIQSRERRARRALYATPRQNRNMDRGTKMQHEKGVKDDSQELRIVLRLEVAGTRRAEWREKGEALRVGDE
ncbi:hypothetical protein B0H14DRAFT_3727877 [Mycena olivaceomarginata]|nr:hypothetical protein B0H14DRAFT_3727877 [Mycena olivaceomarginata]